MSDSCCLHCIWKPFLRDSCKITVHMHILITRSSDNMATFHIGINVFHKDTWEHKQPSCPIVQWTIFCYCNLIIKVQYNKGISTHGFGFLSCLPQRAGINPASLKEFLHSLAFKRTRESPFWDNLRAKISFAWLLSFVSQGYSHSLYKRP